MKAILANLTMLELSQLNLRNEEGWLGTFTRDQFPGALPNNTRVIKIRKDRGDFQDIGALGTVLGSIGLDDTLFGYFIEWDARKKTAIFVAAFKIDKKE